MLRGIVGCEAGKYLLAAIVLLYLFFRVLKPMLHRLTHNLSPPTTALALNGAVPDAEMSSDEQLLEDDLVTISGYQKNLGMAKELARNDPRIVANVIKTWVSSNE